MKRKIYKQLLEWKRTSSGDTALMIDGARRIGKSWIAEEFARNEYKTYLIIDFNNPPAGVTELFETQLYDLDLFFSQLSLLTNTKLYRGESIIIFDEVQLYPRARAALKYLVQDGRYHYLETGSLVSINHNVKDIVIPSEERRIDMYPMDFEEFMWALDQNDLWDYIRQGFEKKRPVGQVLHRKAMQYLRTYFLTGGMPQAVLKYINTTDFKEVDRIKRDIIALYRNDISKFAGRQAPKVSLLFDNIPAILQQPLKRLRPSKLKAGSRMRDFSEAIFWLNESRVANFCYFSSEPNIGLALSEDFSKVKVYMGDTGLLLSMAFSAEQLVSEEIYKKILFDKLEFNKGMIVENYVSQQLVAAGHPLYFFLNPSERIEIDFLLSKGRVSSRHNIIPVEVKSNTKYTTTSLSKFTEKYASFTSKGIILHSGDLDDDDKFLHLPLYMASLL